MAKKTLRVGVNIKIDLEASGDGKPSLSLRIRDGGGFHIPLSEVQVIRAALADAAVLLAEMEVKMMDIGED